MTKWIYYSKDGFDQIEVDADIKYQETRGYILHYSDWVNGWFGNDAFVDKNFRRMGIITAIYEFAEEIIVEKLVPSLSLSPNMEKFWSKRE